VIGFITLVQILPQALHKGEQSGLSRYETELDYLKKGIALLGGKVSLAFNVLGNDFDLLLIGDVTDPRTLHRIDVFCKAKGYTARTHPVVEAAEYAQLVLETTQIVGGQRIGHADTRSKEA
jgi:uncharacterized protein with GYD domain